MAGRSTSSGQSAAGGSDSGSSESVTSGSGTGGFVSVRNFGELTVPAGSVFSFTLPRDTFKHGDPKASIGLEARGPDGKDLPAWLKFEPGTGRFTGSPPEGLKEFAVVVTARDNSGGEVSTQVVLKFGADRGKASAK